MNINESINMKGHARENTKENTKENIEGSIEGNLEGNLEGLTIADLTKSVVHLTNAHKALDCIRELINDNLYNWFSMSEYARDAWNECNQCRLYTERLYEIEERLYPLMGLINDGKCMVDSLWNWNIGCTCTAQYNLVITFRAAQCGLGEIIAELESRISADSFPEQLDEETALFVAGALGG